MNSENIIESAFTILILFCVTLLVGGFIAGIAATEKEKGFLTENKCILQSEVKTGKKRYCGKACFKDEIEQTYQRSFGEHVITH